MKFTISEGDFLYAHCLHASPGKFARVVIISWAIFSVCLTTSAIWVLVVQGRFFFLPMLPGVALLFFGMSYLQRTRQLKKIYAQQAAFCEDIEVLTQADHLEFNTKNSHFKLEYGKICKLKLDDRMFLVYLNDALFQIIPLRGPDEKLLAESVNRNFQARINTASTDKRTH